VAAGGFHPQSGGDRRSTPGLQVWPMRSTFRLSSFLFSLAMAGCVAGQDAPASHAEAIGESSAGISTPAAADTSKADSDAIALPGYWTGTTTAYCNLNPAEFDMRCNSINVITLSLLQDKDRVTGFYRCSFGNQDCRAQNDAGKVANASMRGRQLRMRIALPDLSSCIFQGKAVSPASIKGAYFCYQGGGLMEQGHFEIRRQL
jgi:hypothetical protein